MPIDFNSMVGGEAYQNVQSVGFLLARFFVRGQEMFERLRYANSKSIFHQYVAADASGEKTETIVLE